jgi:oligopeptide/dipeptide ABC transporter ATP-binding protein
MVGLSADYMTRLPNELSGGQRQRVVIARALAVEPQFVVADEPVSALDVSVQAQIIALLKDLKQRLGLSMIFISHNLAVVEYLADRIAVVYLGRIMEIGTAAEVCGSPKHPYTIALLSAVLDPDTANRRQRVILQGDLPDPANPPSGCVFRTRCPYAIADCATKVPEMRSVSATHARACIRDDIG